VKLQHYLGGLEGLDCPLDFEKRVFVEAWERRIFGIHVAMMGLSSSLRDALPGYDLDKVPSAFTSTWIQYRYYEKWLGGITAYLIDNGYLTQSELDAVRERYRHAPAATLPQFDSEAIDDQVIRYLREGDSPWRGPASPAFAVGDRVTVRNPPTGDHTRLPGYLRGRSGAVERVFEGNYAYFCSTGADGLGDPCPVYVVGFDPMHVWGPQTEANAGPLLAEIYEVYLLPEPVESQ
jgi:nitrile hydratase